jgi:hypothetical protein
MTQDDRPLGNVANKLLFENDLVRVWEMTLAPGERSDRHRHEHPYLLSGRSSPAGRRTCAR